MADNFGDTFPIASVILDVTGFPIQSTFDCGCTECNITLSSYKHMNTIIIQDAHLMGLFHVSVSYSDREIIEKPTFIQLKGNLFEMSE